MFDPIAALHGPSHRTVRLVVWAMLAVSLLLPWGTGAAVKIYLDALGQPTYPWVYYINPWTLAVFVVPSTLYWSSPLLALLAAWRFTARPERIFSTTRCDRLIVLVGGFTLGAVGAVRLYVPLFWDIENSTVPAGRLPLLYLPWILVGLILGAMAVLIGHRIRQPSPRVLR